MQIFKAPVDPKSRLERLAARARYVLLWERLWPCLAAALSVGAFFLAASWFGFWTVSPTWVRIVGDIGFGAASLACFLPLLRGARISRKDLLGRLDRDSGLPHRPASSLEDRLANDDGDPITRALWALHRRRQEEVAASLRLAPPAPKLRERDPRAIRAAALVLLIAAGFVAGPQKASRLLSAFDWGAAGAPGAGFRLDVWVDPPAYTGRPPVLLTDPSGEASLFSSAQERRAQAPTGSSVVVRVARMRWMSIETSGGLAAPDTTDPKPSGSSASPLAPALASDADEHRWTLKGNGVLTVRRYGLTIATFNLEAIPNPPPRIALVAQPQRGPRGGLTLRYETADAYGVVGAEADFSDGRPSDRRPSRTLAPPPKANLSLPSSSHGIGRAETAIDVSESPWAGARVVMTLTAKDEAGLQGASGPLTLTLPQRPFSNPVSKALVEQRRRLVLDPDSVVSVAAAIDALWFDPEDFQIRSAVYLGLRHISTRLAAARSDAELLASADEMWDMAVRLEDGDLAAAQRALDAARQQLQDALQNGASQAQIAKLTEQLRQSLDRFLQTLARQQRNSDQAQSARGPTRSVTPDELRSMIDRMEQMARSGDADGARRLMQQLQALLQNLQPTQNGSADPTSREMNRALNDLDQLTRDQQSLRDRTFQADRDGNAATRQQLQQDQRKLGERLQALQRRLKDLGADARQGLDDAGRDMQDAETSLGDQSGSADEAVSAQGRALQALRRGAQSLAQQMQQQGQGMGQAGQAGTPGGSAGSGEAGVDPLGRDIQNGGAQADGRYDPLGASAAQRAQQVLEELRRRLSDAERPQDEIDYLERLLKPDGP